MDRNFGRQTTTADDRSQMQIFASHFETCGLKSRQTGHGFIPGCNVFEIRVNHVRQAMQTMHGGVPELLLVEDTTQHTQREFYTYTKTKLPSGDIVDKPSNPRIHDCMAAVEYGLAFIKPLYNQGMAYVERVPDPLDTMPAWMSEFLMEDQRQKRARSVHLGPGVAA